MFYLKLISEISQEGSKIKHSIMVQLLSVYKLESQYYVVNDASLWIRLWDTQPKFSVLNICQLQINLLQRPNT